MVSLTEVLARVAAARHRSGCYRWYRNGRRVDCGRYAGTAADVIEVVTAGGVIYSSPTAKQQSRLARLVGRATDLATAGRSPTESASPATFRRLTARVSPSFWPMGETGESL